MPYSKDYRLYLEEKFEGLQTAQHAYFREVHDRFDVIDKSNDIRNGRLEKVEKSIDDLKEQDVKHTTNCPLVPKVEGIEKDLMEYRMIRKYPKISILIITVAVLGSIFAFMKITNKEVNAAVDMATDELTNEIRLMDGVSKETRGYVKYRDVKGFTDSVKVR